MTAAQAVCLELARVCRISITADEYVDAADDYGVPVNEYIVAMRTMMGNLYRQAGVRACRRCGCTDRDACENRCAWISDPPRPELGSVCTNCLDAERAVFHD